MKQFLTIALTCLPLLCIGAPTYTTYFNNTHTYTNATIAGTNFAGRGVFTNGITAGASAFTGAVGFADGTAAAPSIAWTSDQDGSGTGFYRNSANAISASLNGTQSYRWNTTGFSILNDSYALIFGASSDVFLQRDGAANTLALRNSTAAQAFNIYNTYTDASNYERCFIGWSGNSFFVGPQKAGTGQNRVMQVGSVASSRLDFFTAVSGGSAAWQMTSGGHFLAGTDNTYDIGASGATRPRAIYVATTGTFGGGVTAGGFVSAVANTIGWSGRTKVFGGTTDGVLLIANDALSDFNRLQFGGTTASFPALKRSSTEIQVRLADDSADAPLKSGQLSNTGIRVMTPSSLQTLAAANALLANATKVRVVGSGGAVTLTSTPTIADGSDGQYVMIQGTDDTNTLTVQDQGSLASSNLELGAATRVLGAGDVLVLTFDSTASVWYEVSFANN